MTTTPIFRGASPQPEYQDPEMGLRFPYQRWVGIAVFCNAVANQLPSLPYPPDRAVWNLVKNILPSKSLRSGLHDKSYDDILYVAPRHLPHLRRAFRHALAAEALRHLRT